MYRLFSIIILILMCQIQLKAQTGLNSTVSGFVYDNTNGEALIGANVYFKDLGIGASTNLSGYFAIPNVPMGSQVLVISFLGYKTEEMPLKVEKQNKIIKIYLRSDAVETKEIVITADSARTIDKLFAKPVSKIELSAKQINNVPKVVEADLLRSLQTLPGIQALSDFSSALYIRGGTPDQNLYLIDGTDVYNPEHAFGLFSTFNTNAIKKVELSKGGFSAEYGGRLSSILNVTNLDGNRNNFQGDASISLLSASTTLQMPLGSIGSISGSIRRTYMDKTIAKFVDEIPDYYFYDGNLKAFIDLSPKNKIVASFYGGQDKLDYKFDKKAESPIGFQLDWGNTTGSINWKTIFNPELFANFWVTASHFRSYFNFEEAHVKEENQINDLTFKGSLEYYMSKNFNVKFGFEQKNITGLLKDDFEDGKVDVSKRRSLYTAWASAIWRPTENWDIETGLRYDYFVSDKDYFNYDPRFSLKYRLSETINLKFSAGTFHQYVHRMPRGVLTSIWLTSDENYKGSTSNHFIFGIQKELGQIYELEIEGYYKTYKDIYSYNQNFLADLKPERYDEKNEPVYSNSTGLLNRGDGNSIGLEVLLRKDYGAVTGWVGYSLSRTENTIDNVNSNKSFVPRHDRTSTVNLLMNIDINKFFDELHGSSDNEGKSKWLLGLNFVYATGQPITIPSSTYLAGTMPDFPINNTNIGLYPSELNTVRLPAYSRLDLSLTYEKNYGSWTLAPYLQIFNIGNRKNVWFIQYKNEVKENIVSQEIKNITMLPILPSIGVNIKF
ncbi:MAG: TonB-dependent receptor [Bacillota bacterium]